MTSSPSNKVRAAGLLSPLLIFVLLFFAWPLIAMMAQAVSDTAVIKVLPRTATAINRWDRVSAPSQEMQAALADDLRDATDDQAVGDMVRRLNSAKSGFRTLMAKTISAVHEQGAAGSLVDIDARWGQNSYWLAIAGSLAPMTDRNLLGAIDLTRDGSGRIVSLPAGSSANADIILRTFWIAAIVTLATAILGYPYAMVIAGARGWKRNLLLGSVLLPLWTSLLVRTAAWFIILQEKGVINQVLQNLHLITEPFPLIFNRVGVIIAMTHVLLPFMVLPTYGALLGIPQNLVPAAASLGANPFRRFRRVTFPLSVRGLASGCLLVFMSAIGYYITPALIGGPGDQMISSVIAFYATGTANWGMAAALGLVLLFVTLILYSVYVRISADDPKRG